MIDDSDVKERWINSSYTRSLLSRAMRDREKAFGYLVKCCGESSDPDVVRAYGKYKTQCKLEEILQGE